MAVQLPTSISATQASFLRSLIGRLSADPRIVAILAGGSYLTNELDRYSDLDLVLAIEPGEYAAVTLEREALAASLGPLLAAFGGEHVGEPRLLICLFAEPLLHVDLKLVELGDLSDRVEDPAVLWERDGRATAALAAGVAEYPAPDPAWLERRFWVWVHYTAAKIGRGELFEALRSLDYLRSAVLGPLGLLRAGARPSGVRRLESSEPELARRLRASVASYDAADCLRCLEVCVDTYRWLRPLAGAEPPPVELAVRRYLQTLESTIAAPKVPG
jgi:hypothetical protein